MGPDCRSGPSLRTVPEHALALSPVRGRVELHLKREVDVVLVLYCGTDLVAAAAVPAVAILEQRRMLV